MFIFLCTCQAVSEGVNHQYISILRSGKMDPDVGKALDSNDAALIKNVRAVEKGDVTRISNRLEKLLIQNEDGSFDISNISPEKIDEVEKDLKVAKEGVTKLHKRYILK